MVFARMHVGELDGVVPPNSEMIADPSEHCHRIRLTHHRTVPECFHDRIRRVVTELGTISGIVNGEGTNPLQIPMDI